MTLKYNTHTLNNGLRIVHLPSDNNVVYCGYGICAGTRDEYDNEAGLAHFCEHAAFKGTERRSSMRVISTLESVGGDLNAFTNKEDTVFHAAVLREHMARAVDLLTDIVFHSSYPAAEIEKEAEVICDEIESYNDSPADLIYDDFEAAVFSGHQLGRSILGSAESVRRYTSDDIRAFTARHYRPQNAVFFAYGNVDFNRLVRMIERATSDFAAALPLLHDDKNVALPPYEARRTVVEKHTHQAHLMIGCRAYGARDKGRMALHLINNMLGGPAMSARLNVALREKRGLVYTVDSSMVCYSDAGLWCTYLGCDPDDVSKCRRIVTAELEKMMRKPLSAAALAAAKRQIRGQIGVACENRESFALDMAKVFLHYNKTKDIDAMIADIDAITAEDILNVSRETFNRDRLTELVFM